MAICEICGNEHYSTYSSRICDPCRKEEDFKSNIKVLMSRIKYIQDTYNITFSESINILNLYILENKLDKINDSADSIKDAVYAI